MEVKEFQRQVKDHFEKSGFKVWPKFASIVRLQEEISEIARIVSVEEGLREKWKVDNMNYTDEFGDALFQLVHLANQCDVDLDESIAYVMKKYQKYIDISKKNAPINWRCKKCNNPLSYVHAGDICPNPECRLGDN